MSTGNEKLKADSLVFARVRLAECAADLVAKREANPESGFLDQLVDLVKAWAPAGMQISIAESLVVDLSLRRAAEGPASWIPHEEVVRIMALKRKTSGFESNPIYQNGWPEGLQHMVALQKQAEAWLLASVEDGDRQDVPM